MFSVPRRLRGKKLRVNSEPGDRDVNLFERDRFLSLEKHPPQGLAAVDIAYYLESTRAAVIDSHSRHGRGSASEQGASLAIGQFQGPGERVLAAPLLTRFGGKRLGDRE